MQISRLLTSSDRSTTPISFSVCAVQNERKESARKRERERERRQRSQEGERERPWIIIQIARKRRSIGDPLVMQRVRPRVSRRFFLFFFFLPMSAR